MIVSPEIVNDLIQWFASQKVAAHVIGQVILGNGDLKWVA